MKKLIALFTPLLAAVAVRAALPQPDLIAQIHFAGAQKISAAANAAAFTNEFCSAEALALRKQTADKLSVWLSGWLQKNLGAVVPDGAAKLRPLFDDLQKSEWFLEARAVANGKPEMALAIKLEAGRAQLWQANLKPFFAAAGFKSTGGWLVFDSGPGAPPLGDRLAREISQADSVWFFVDVNWPRLAQWYPQLKELGLPETQFHVAAPDASLHIDGKFFFPENLSLNLEPWRVPTNTLHQPFISLTAVRGFSAWLKSQAWAQPYGLAPTPNQFFVWALPGVPYQTFAAIPAADAVDSLAQARARLQPVFDSQNKSGNFISHFTLEQTTNTEVSLQGMPFISPFLRAIRSPAGQFLLAGAFPNTPRSKPLPADLFRRLAEKNLVFYHWEITAERLPLALNLSQLGLMLTSHRQLGGDSAAMKWIQKIAPTLGNTVTEITQTAPDQLVFTRSAPGGFTAMELLALGNWLEAPSFPGCDLKLPPRPAKFKRPHPAPMAAPAPVPAK
ncbi:MAG TPA: hypothetical protein VGI63_03565 [Verrucomicrobiae bacterium]